uniref:Uncharacterized protein n=1 Tax=Ananas comosus var. bracteatus TaxID=296719 RepID=A0A6V7QG45_ANACO|nr:unnamed protein product [Ananas comosus var. bracteatus]
MRRSSTPENLLEFICEPQQVAPSPRRSPYSTRPPNPSPATPSTPPSPRSLPPPPPPPPPPDPDDDVAARTTPAPSGPSSSNPSPSPSSSTSTSPPPPPAPTSWTTSAPTLAATPAHRKVFIYPLRHGTTPAFLVDVLRAHFGPDSVECALVAPAAYAALVDNPKVVAGNLVLCERVLHITDPEPHHLLRISCRLSMPPLPMTAEGREGPREGARHEAAAPP